MKKILLLGLSSLACFTMLSACDEASTTSQNTSATTSVETVKNNANQQFIDLMDAHWANAMAQSPTYATTQGVRDYDDQLDDPSIEAYEAAIEKTKGFLAQMNDIDRAALSADQKINYDLLKMLLQRDIENAQYNGKYLILTNRSGPHMTLTRMPSWLPFFKDNDYESYVTRLGLMSDYMDKSTKRIQLGLDKGWTLPCGPMTGYEQSISAHIVNDVTKSIFYRPLRVKPDHMDQEKFDALQAKAADIISTQIIPSFKEFETFYLENYKPNCQTQVGISRLDGGMDYYDQKVRDFTTLDISADEIHNIGLSEVARILGEMEEVKTEAGFDGTLKEFITFLRNDPQFYPKTAEERMRAAATISKKMDGEIPKLFTKLPRMPYGLKPIPEDIAAKTTTAYYMPPAGDGTRAGVYYLNTTNLSKRPLYELEALSLHEAVPGHHFQIALAQELDLPNFRRDARFTSFVEGWGLYSERLGMEVGFYETPYTNFGRLSYEMWRACRLVVDTGMHSKGWSRQDAIDYMMENSALSEHNIRTEVDRYATWPGQALAYKMGELKIRELRSYAEAELGSDFDVRYFHDTVLENGAIPLSLLESHVKEWVASEKERLNK